MPKKIFPRRAFLMEKMEGSLEEIYRKLSKDQEIALEIQRLSVDLILRQEHVITTDSNKHRNILYKKLGPEDMFKGERLQDFDFWKYVFGNYSLYLPKPSFLIKLGDYDQWSYRANEETKDLNPEKDLRIYCDWNLLSLDTLAEKFKKPTNPDARILEIFSF